MHKEHFDEKKRTDIGLAMGKGIIRADDVEKLPVQVSQGRSP